MLYGICNLSIIPGRETPSDKSEMLTHILFGEHFELIDKQPKWCKIRLAYINYECWIDDKQFTMIDKSTYDKLNDNRPYLSAELVSSTDRKENGETLTIVRGSTLPFFDGYMCTLGKHQYIFNGKVIAPQDRLEQNMIIEHAYTYLHAPYTWGGRSPFGIDCSGLTQMAYKLCGIWIPRDACQQAEFGQSTILKDALPADLAFFENEDGKIVHVGIILENNKIIHASGKVRIDILDERGIYNVDTKKYSHKLSGLITFFRKDKRTLIY